MIKITKPWGKIREWHGIKKRDCWILWQAPEGFWHISTIWSWWYWKLKTGHGPSDYACFRVKRDIEKAIRKALKEDLLEKLNEAKKRLT